MIDWLWNRFHRAYPGLADFAATVGDTFTAIWRLTSRFWLTLKSVFGFFAAVANGFRDLLWKFLESTYIALRHIIVIVIPRWIDIAIRRAVDLSNQLISASMDLIRGIVHTLQEWALSAVNALRGGLAALTGWITSTIATILNILTAVRDRVVQLLTDPRVLAQWLIGAMWETAWRYAYARRDAIASFLMTRALGLTATGAAVAEDVLTRIL